MGREPSNPPQSQAPPQGPAAQGATSDQASGRLQIRSALSPPAGSGDPPPVPSAPAPLRAAAQVREGPGRPAAARGVSQLLPRARTTTTTTTTHPLLLGDPRLCGDPGPEDTGGLGAVYRSRTQRPAHGARVRVPGRVGAWPSGRESLGLCLANLSLPSVKAHLAQSDQGAVPARCGLQTPSRAPPLPKGAYPSHQSRFHRATEHTSSWAVSYRPQSHHPLPVHLQILRGQVLIHCPHLWPGPVLRLNRPLNSPCLCWA